jgi:hypothetical protein
MVVLWCSVLAFAFLGPPIGRMAWRRRRRAGAADVVEIRGDAR